MFNDVREPLPYGNDDDFDYEALTCSDTARDSIRGSVLAIYKMTTDSRRSIGGQLVLIKHFLPHGEFGKLVKECFSFSGKTAANYMLLAQFTDAEYVTVSDLNLSAVCLYELAAAPQEVRQAVLGQIERGEPIESTAIQKMASAAKAAAKAAHKGRLRKKKDGDALAANAAPVDAVAEPLESVELRQALFEAVYHRPNQPTFAVPLAMRGLRGEYVVLVGFDGSDEAKVRSFFAPSEDLLMEFSEEMAESAGITWDDSAIIYEDGTSAYPVTTYGSTLSPFADAVTGTALVVREHVEDDVSAEREAEPVAA